MQDIENLLREKSLRTSYKLSEVEDNPDAISIATDYMTSVDIVKIEKIANLKLCCINLYDDNIQVHLE